MLQVVTNNSTYSVDKTTVKVVKISSKSIATKSKKYLTRLELNNQQQNNSNPKETNFKNQQSIMFLMKSHLLCGHQLKATNTMLQRIMELETKINSKTNQDSLIGSSSNNLNTTHLLDLNSNNSSIRMRQFNTISQNSMATNPHTTTIVTPIPTNNNKQQLQTTVSANVLNQGLTQVQHQEFRQLSYTNHQVAVLKSHLHE
jgi:hypothetical protein